MDDEVFITRSLNFTPKTTEQHLTVRSGKSEAEVTNNRRVHWRYCTIGDWHSTGSTPPGLQLDNEVSQSMDQPRGTVCHQEYGHRTCR